MGESTEQLRHLKEMEKAIRAAIRDEVRCAQLAHFYDLLREVQRRLREQEAP